MIIYAYNLTLFTVTEVDADKISVNGRAIKGNQIFHKWSPNRELAVGHVLEALSKEIKRRQDGIVKLQKIRESYDPI